MLDDSEHSVKLEGLMQMRVWTLWSILSALAVIQPAERLPSFVGTRCRARRSRVKANELKHEGAMWADLGVVSAS